MRKLFFRILYEIRLKFWISKFGMTDEERFDVVIQGDPIRYGTVLLALKDIEEGNISGDFAEVGVFKGKLSQFIRKYAPNRKIYLFDTFQGFPSQYTEDESDERFCNTSVEAVKKEVGDCTNVIFRIGEFPSTARGLEMLRFSFVMLDLDLYEPTLEGLRFFYPRLNSGGYLFLHDYNSPESNWAVKRAVTQFCKETMIYPISLPDGHGSIVVRKP